MPFNIFISLLSLCKSSSQCGTWENEANYKEFNISKRLKLVKNMHKKHNSKKKKDGHRARIKCVDVYVIIALAKRRERSDGGHECLFDPYIAHTYNVGTLLPASRRVKR